MPAVLVHGNPETPAVWDPLRARLARRDLITPAVPGFGVAAPQGFGATKDEYVVWLVGELERLTEDSGEPVDLVGHDWGGGFVLRVAAIRPDLIRSWVSDVAGILDPEYTWHDFAQIWQTPEAGEQYFADVLAQPVEARAAMYEAISITPAEARAFAEAADEEMARCVLALYRSARKPDLAEWSAGADAARAKPGLVISPSEDPFTGGTDLSRRSADRLGARFEVLDGLGHWWMLQDPAAGAAVLESFWSSL